MTHSIIKKENKAGSTSRRVVSFASAACAALLMVGFAHAQSAPTSEARAEETSTEYWTPERLRNAVPVAPPKYDLERAIEQELAEEENPPSRTPAEGGGRAPKVQLPLNLQLFDPSQGGFTPSSDETPNNVGTQGIHFSSTRVTPLSAALSFPFRTAGKLFFRSQDGGDYVCSGSVLRPRVVLTAGHCVYDADASQANDSGNPDTNGKGFHSQFLFVPAFQDGTAPFGEWDWQFVTTTNTWANGGGTVPNAADYAMFEMRDQTIRGVVRKIAELTGYLGYRTVSLNPNHVTAAGYPGNLDSGRKLHLVHSACTQAGGNNTAQIGSDMRGGSSGGPWVQNMGTAAVGQTNGLNTGSNRVVGITSYGPTAVGPLYQGSSIPDSRFTNLLTLVCNHRLGNC